MVQASKNVSSHDRLRARIKLQVHESLPRLASVPSWKTKASKVRALLDREARWRRVGTIHNHFHDRQESSFAKFVFKTAAARMLSAIDQGMKEVDGEAFRAQLDHFAHVLLSYYTAGVA